MTTHPQLDSAAAVKVAAFCWPKDDPQQAWRELVDREAISSNGYETDTWGFRTFDDLHRAAAVLVERGLGHEFDRAFAAEVNICGCCIGPSTVAAAPADAWARAILQTVREVRNA